MKLDKRCGSRVQGVATAFMVQGQAKVCGGSCSLFLHLRQSKGCAAISVAIVLIAQEQCFWCGGSVAFATRNCTFYCPFHHHNAIHFLSVCSSIMDLSCYWDMDITRGSLYTLIIHPSSCSLHLMPHPEFSLVVL